MDNPWARVTRALLYWQPVGKVLNRARSSTDPWDTPLFTDHKAKTVFHRCEHTETLVYWGGNVLFVCAPFLNFLKIKYLCLLQTWIVCILLSLCFFSTTFPCFTVLSKYFWPCLNKKVIQPPCSVFPKFIRTLKNKSIKTQHIGCIPCTKWSFLGKKKNPYFFCSMSRWDQRRVAVGRNLWRSTGKKKKKKSNWSTQPFQSIHVFS